MSFAPALHQDLFIDTNAIVTDADRKIGPFEPYLDFDSTGLRVSEGVSYSLTDNALNVVVNCQRQDHGTARDEQFIIRLVTTLCQLLTQRHERLRQSTSPKRRFA